jgi:aspartate aminotransferase-like enzyme
MQEAGIRNFVQETVLSCVNGSFSQRWFDVAASNGKQADSLEVDWGEPILPDKLAIALKQKHYEAVTIVHNETSTGVENPLEELAAVVHDVSPDTMIMVDAVSSLAVSRSRWTRGGLTSLLTSSQKALGASSRVIPGGCFKPGDEKGRIRHKPGLVL